MKYGVWLVRLLFAAWMIPAGINHFYPLFRSLWAPPTGAEPLAMQLMMSLANSRPLDVAMVVQLITGALILPGILVALALCVLMPISTCASFWALILDHQPLTATLTLAAFALNGLLMPATFANQVGYISLNGTPAEVPKWLAFAVFAAFVLWGCARRSSPALTQHMAAVDRSDNEPGGDQCGRSIPSRFILDRNVLGARWLRPRPTPVSAP